RSRRTATTCAALIYTRAMAKTRVGINGFGRIGRNFFRAHLERGGDFEIVAINDLGDAKTMGHLLKYDSVLGTLAEDVEVGDGVIKAGKTELQVLSEKDPSGLPWRELDVELVIESTGICTDRRLPRSTRSRRPPPPPEQSE